MNLKGTFSKLPLQTPAQVGELICCVQREPGDLWFASIPMNLTHRRVWGLPLPTPRFALV